MMSSSSWNRCSVRKKGGGSTIVDVVDCQVVDDIDCEDIIFLSKDGNHESAGCCFLLVANTECGKQNCVS